MAREWKAIELFCGAGGTSLGFQMAGGFKVLLGIDFDKDAMHTYSQNHEEAICITEDITSIPPTSIIDKVGNDAVDIIIGGPSCQGYSTIGKRISDDPRNSLYTNYLDYVDRIRPRWIVFENVRGFLHSGKGKFFNAFRDSLESLGYQLAAGVLNAADYGVPQRRERVIIIGTNSGKMPSLPESTHEDPRCPVCTRPDKSGRVRASIKTEQCGLCAGTGFWHVKSKRPWVSLRDAFSDLPLLDDFGGHDGLAEYDKEPASEYQNIMRSGAKGYTLHKANRVSDFAHSIISKIPPGGGIRHIPENELPERFRSMRTVKGGKLRKDCTTLYGRLNWDMPSYTITCYFKNVSSGAFTHPEMNRALTIREAARLQSFPDWYNINPKGAMRQIGNAVPPLLAKAIAQHIKKIESDEVIGAKEEDSTSTSSEQLKLFAK